MKLFVYRAAEGTYLSTSTPGHISRTIKDFFYVEDINRAYVSTELPEYIRKALPKAVVPIEVHVKRVVTPVVNTNVTNNIVSLYKPVKPVVKTAETVLEEFRNKYNGRMLIITWEKENSNKLCYDSYGIDCIDFITMCNLAKALEEANYVKSMDNVSD